MTNHEASLFVLMRSIHELLLELSEQYQGIHVSCRDLFFTKNYFGIIEIEIFVVATQRTARVTCSGLCPQILITFGGDELAHNLGHIKLDVAVSAIVVAPLAVQWMTRPVIVGELLPRLSHDALQFTNS